MAQRSANILHRDSRRKLSFTDEVCVEDPCCPVDQPGYGLMITLENGVCELSFCADANFPQVHPNSYAPAALQNVHTLSGGGSGVAVFGGTHPELGEIVMKHGGEKDLQELFALATIARELDIRGRELNAEAAHDLKQCIPEYRMIYISPFHLGEKRRNLFQRLHHLYRYASRHSSSVLSAKHHNSKELNGVPCEEQHCDAKTSGDLKLNANSFAKREVQSQRCSSCIEGSTSETMLTAGYRDIVVSPCNKNSQGLSVRLTGESLTLVVPESESSFETQGPTTGKRRIKIRGDGYSVLKAFVDDLTPLMKENQWKFTLAQKCIGGMKPMTGNSWLYSGKLEGRLLDTLIAQKIRIVRDLASLTTPDEQDDRILKNVTREVESLEETHTDVSLLSSDADKFVGNSIKKNFQDDTGRFPVLMVLGEQFRDYQKEHKNHHHENNGLDCYCSEGSCSMVLTPEEEIPARYLGALIRPGALMGDTFENVPREPNVLDTMRPHYWRDILKLAVQSRQRNGADRTTAMALRRIWTCGFSDAGLHNLFLSEDSLSLFDLGQPSLNSAPGILTKFLFSFFHTLGMEEAAGSNGREWINCFVQNKQNEKLVLTHTTEQKLSNAYRAFEVTLDRFVNELFDGDDTLRWLLVQYVTLQLLSDASFCLQKWTVKGGGRARDKNHQQGIEKWLWRALWDLYVAFDINTCKNLSRLKVRDPTVIERDSPPFVVVDAIDGNDVASVDRRRTKVTLDEYRAFHQCLDSPIQA